MAKFFDPSTGGIVDDGPGPLPTRQSSKGVEINPEIKKLADDYLREIETKKKQEEAKKKIKPTKEQLAKQETQKVIDQFIKDNPKLSQTKFPTRAEREAASTEFVRPFREAKKKEIQRQKTLQEEGRKIPFRERVKADVGSGVVSLASGLYAIPAEVIKSQLKDEQIAREALGRYGQSVEDLQKFNQDLDTQLQAIPKDAGLLERGAYTAAEITGQLIPQAGLMAVGLPGPAVGALTGIAGSVGKGDIEGALAEGVFGAAGIGAGAALEKVAAKAAAEKFVGEGVKDVVKRELYGRALTGAAGAATGEIEAGLRGFDREQANKTTITNAVMDFLFYGGQPKKAKTQQKIQTEISKASEPEFVATNFAQPIEGYYSQLKKVINEKFPNKVSPQQAVAMLRDPKYGIRADEYDYAGLDELITAKAVNGMPITKTEILETIEQNQPIIGEKILGNGSAVPKMQLREIEIQQRLNELGPNGRFTPEGRQLSIELGSLEEKINNAQTQFGIYKALPGADPDSYTELLITMNRPGQDSNDNFVESHWPQTPNILASARFDLKQDSSGKKILQLQEIQSDWHQKGRERGYTGKGEVKVENPKRQELLNQINQITEQSRTEDGQYTDWEMNFEDKTIYYDPDSGRYTVTERGTGEFLDNYFTVPDLLEDLTGRGGDNPVPDAPFKNTWQELAFKRVLNWAATNNIDKIVWPKGSQQIDLYTTNLRQNVDKINLYEVLPGEYTITAEKNGSQVLAPRIIKNRDELNELVGPTVADSLLSKGVAEGEDLSIGGQVHKLLYDQKLPQLARSLAKKTGSVYKIEDTTVKGSNNPILDNLAIERNVPVHSFELSQLLRDKILTEGQPLYNQKLPKPPKDNKQAIEIHEQWGVPKIPPDSGASIVDNVSYSRWTMVETPRGPVVYSNTPGMGLLVGLYQTAKTMDFDPLDLHSAVFDKVFDSLQNAKQYQTGINFPLKTLKDFAAQVNNLIEPQFRDIISSLSGELNKAISVAEKNQDPSVVFISLDNPDKVEITRDLRHEEIHRTHGRIENETNRNLVDFDWFANVPNFNRIRQALRMRGYDPQAQRSVVTETLAHLGAGQYEDIGLTSQQAANSFASILGHIAERNGIEAVRKFNFDPEWRNLLRDTVRKSQAIRRQVESGTRMEGGNRSFFDRLRDWWNGKGKADGDRGVSDPIPADPEFARKPWENVDDGLDTRKWSDDVRKFFESGGQPYQMTWIDRLRKEFVDQMLPVWKTWDYLTQNQTILPEDNAFYLMRLWMGGREKISDALKNGIPNPRGRGYMTPGGVNWLFEPFKGTKAEFKSDMKAVIQLVISQRTLELSTRKAGSPASGVSVKDPITGVSGQDYVHTSSTGKKYKINNPFKADIIAAVSKINEIYNSSDPNRIARLEEGAKRYRQWSEALLDYAEAKGLMTQQKANELRQSNQLYADLHRVFDDNEDALKDSAPKKIGLTRKVFRKFFGSEKDIGNVYTNLIMQTDNIIREADRNEAMNKFVQPLRDILYNPQTVSSAQYKFYQNIGKVSTTYTKDAIKVMRNGIQEYWQFHPELHATLGQWDQYPKLYWFEKALFPLKILRSSITHSPGFIVRNLLRDAQQRTLLSRLNDSVADIFNPLAGAKPWDSIRELFKPASLTNRQAMWQYGAGQAGHYLSSRMDYQARLRSGMNDLVNDRNTVLVSAEKVGDFLWNQLPQLSETATRSAEFNEQYKRARAAGLDDHNANIKAAFETRDLMDFAQAGRTVAFLNKFFLFLNPAVQGLRREVSAAKESPLPFLMRWGMYSAFPTAMEFAWNSGVSDENNEALEQWRQMPNWRKDMFFNLNIGADRWISIPKPFTSGVASSLGNRLIDKFVFGNQKALEGSDGSIVKALIPVDDAAIWGPWKAYMETQANYSAFYGEDIVSSFEEGRNPELRGERGTGTGRAASAVAEYTAGLPKKLAYNLGLTADKYLQWDPRKMDYFIRSSFGDFGLFTNYTGEMINLALAGDDPKATSDILWRMGKLASGNMVRPAKPDQARDVKHVMKKAQEFYGERSEWFSPVKEAIDRYRESNTNEERKDNAIEAIYAAKRIREFLPDHERQLLKDKRAINAITSLNATFKALDKESQRMVESDLDSQMRELANAEMAAKVKNDMDALTDARDARMDFNLPEAFFEALDRVQELKREKQEKRKETPPIPRR